MFKNYFTTAIRHLLKRKFFTFIHILGLAAGMATCLLILLFVLDELSYDRFHEKADRIYRVTTKKNIDGQEHALASTSYHIAEVMAAEIPEVERTMRVQKFWNWTVKQEDKLYTENQVIAADSNFFHFFTFPLVTGNPVTALKDPSALVLTEEAAHQYFGSKDALGQTLMVNGVLRKVTAIAANPPQNAHFHFNMIVPFEPRVDAGENWTNIVGVVSTYFLLKEHASIASVPDKLHDLFRKYNPQEEAYAGFSIEFIVQPLTDIHLYSHMEWELEANGDIQYVYIFSLIAIFILVLAIVNYVNLSTAQSADRAREVGIRKTLGSARLSLIRQFLSESLLISFLAILLALGLAEIGRPYFNQLAGKALTLNIFSDPSLGLLILGMTVLVGVLAGLYPAFFLTRFQPIQVLKGSFTHGHQGKKLRSTLVVFQFVISTSLIICTGLVFRQLDYLQNKKLGYQKENIILLDNAVQAHYEAFVNTVKSYPQVVDVTASSESPHSIYNSIGDVKFKENEEKEYQFRWVMVEPNFLSTMGMKIKEGRDFSSTLASDKQAVIINEATVKELGLENPLEQTLHSLALDTAYQIIGVIEDFHFQSLKEPIQPILLVLDPYGGEYQVFNEFIIRITGADIPGTIAFLEDIWQQFAPDTPFRYSFLDENYAALYQNEQRLGKVFGIFTGLSVLIACMGLLALVAYMVEQRHKEIGIRKVLGASVQHIVLLLTKGYTRLIVVALFIAIPLSYYIMQQWLRDFAYRIDINVSIFLVSGVAVLVIAWLTVSYQAIKAAIANPVDALRDE